MNWKKRFDEEFPNDQHECEQVWGGNLVDLKDIKDFISTEIIEKLIEDIPDGEYNGIDLGLLKQLLRDRWL